MRVKTKSDHTRPRAKHPLSRQNITPAFRPLKNDCFAVYSTDGKCFKTMASFTRTRIQGQNNRVLTHPTVIN